ncbi:nuclear receptor coactivator 5-like isoform X2 [Monomorium pharaonis]|uniref:nuclear receptor coactivator 5-like isoform X2 n=1 Tax=Monomorium pharaonis TaxID=307658 RepID=UPI001747B304|nr:nuclear receptor coactivator 5-like isoform X2 [Monomorium pharaonis]
MSRQLRSERDHVSRDYQEGYHSDFRDLRDLRDFRDFRDTSLDERDSQGLREGPVSGRTYRDDYAEEYDHRPTAASTSANLERTNNPVDFWIYSWWKNSSTMDILVFSSVGSFIDS